PVEEDVAGLAVLAGDPELALGWAVAVREPRRVARAVELRARVVGHAAVDRCVLDSAASLRRSDPVERHARAADERPAGLERDARRLGPLAAEPLDEGAGELVRRRHALVARVHDPRTAATR